MCVPDAYFAVDRVVGPRRCRLGAGWPLSLFSLDQFGQNLILIRLTPSQEKVERERERERESAMSVYGGIEGLFDVRSPHPNALKYNLLFHM